MATVIEHDVGARDAGASSAMAVILAIVVLAVVIGLALFAFRGTSVPAGTDTPGAQINVDANLPATPAQ